MRPRSAARKRFLGLWSAGWLAMLLVLGMLRFGDPAVQWPVLLVPALWALVALRPRRRSDGGRARRAPREPETVESDLFGDDGYRDDGYRDDGYEDDGYRDDGYEDDGHRHRYGDRYDDRYEDEPYEDDPPAPPPGMRTDTVERPALRRPYDPREDDRW